MSWFDREDEAPPKKGPGNENWKRTYRDIGTRLLNWKTYETSPEHFQCVDCGYYWPTEIDTKEHMGRCWHCWMREAYPSELQLQMRYARDLGKPPAKQQEQEAPRRIEEKKEARAVVQRLGFDGPIKK